MKGDKSRRMALRYAGNNGVRSNEKSFAEVKLVYRRNCDESVPNLIARI